MPVSVKSTIKNQLNYKQMKYAVECINQAEESTHIKAFRVKSEAITHLIPYYMMQVETSSKDLSKSANDKSSVHKRNVRTMKSSNVNVS